MMRQQTKRDPEKFHCSLRVSVAEGVCRLRSRFNFVCATCLNALHAIPPRQSLQIVVRFDESCRTRSAHRGRSIARNELMRGTVGRIAASLAVLLVMASIAEACPSCKEALASGGGQANNL